MFVKFLFSRKKHCFIIFPYNVEINFFNSLRSCYMSRLSEILSHYLDSQTFFHALFSCFSHLFSRSRGTIFDGVRARLRKAASSAFLYKKLLSARWWHIPNPLEQAKRLATQFLRIAIFFHWNFLQK